MNRRANNGVLNQVFEKLKKQRDNPPEALSMDNTIEKVLLAGGGALKTASSSMGKSCGGENARIHVLVGKREPCGEVCRIVGKCTRCA